MPLVDNAWYVNYGNGTNTGYYAVAVWSNHTAVAGEIIRQLTTPAVGSERCFVCTTAGATGAVEPTWTNTRGAINASSTARYTECTGVAALNGDATNTPSWTITATPPGGVKGTAVTLGQVIKRDSGASYQICTIAGTAGSGAEPAFSNTAGTTTADNTVTWTSLGVVGNFTGWQAPHAREENAAASTWGQAGNSFYIASESASTSSAARTITWPGTAASPNFIYCVTKTNVPPTSANLTTGASCSTTGASALTVAGTMFYIEGVAFTCGSSGTPALIFGSTSNGIARAKNCAFKLNSGGTQGMQLGGTNAKPVWENCTYEVTGVGSTIQPQGRFYWYNTASAIAGATLPTTLFSGGISNQTVSLFGVDLNALGSGKTIIGAPGVGISWTFVNCKLGASVTVAGTPTNAGGTVDLVACDSGATSYRAERYNYFGTQTVDTTIVRTGGATDGTTTEAWKIVTTANSKWLFPFEAQPIVIWNDFTSAITTLTIYGTTTGGGVPKDDEVWVEVEYLGSGSTPQGSFKTSTKADNLAASAATNNSADGSTWAGGGAGNGFKIVVPSFTPGMAGPINITVKAAKATTTYYIDPVAYISGQAVSKSFVVAPGVYLNSAGGISRARAFAGFV